MIVVVVVVVEGWMNEWMDGWTLRCCAPSFCRPKEGRNAGLERWSSLSRYMIPSMDDWFLRRIKEKMAVRLDQLAIGD